MLPITWHRPGANVTARPLRSAPPAIPLVLKSRRWALAVVGCGASVLCAAAVPGNGIRPLCDARFWRFERVLGDGTGVVEKTDQGCVVRMASEAPRGMAASWKSAEVPVEPNRR